MAEPVPAGEAPAKTPWTLRAFLALVLIAAAALSFVSLWDLAIAVRIHAELAWLLPVSVDAGAAAACVTWLSHRAPEDARRFARGLTVALLALSVVGNATAQGLVAAGVAPPWWLAVAVGAIPPAVAGGVVHLTVLTTRSPATPAPVAPALPVVPPAGDEPGEDRETVGDDLAELWSLDQLDEHGTSRAWETAPHADFPPAPALPPTGDDRAAELIEQGAGRRRLARELNVSEHEARALLARHKEGALA